MTREDAGCVDPLDQLINDDHEHVSEFALAVRRILRIKLQERSADWLQLLEQEYRERIRPHFDYEETHVFPALLEVCDDPQVAAVVETLRAEHGSVSRAFERALAPEEGADPSALLRDALDALAAHARHEDEDLLPLLRAHAPALRAAVARRRAPG